MDNSADYEISDTFYTESVNMIIRNSNSPDNNSKQTKIYNSIEEFDGSTIGIMEGSYFDELTKQKFPKSKYRNQVSLPVLIMDLFSDETDGFFMDKPIVDYLKNKCRGRVTYYEEGDLPKCIPKKCISKILILKNHFEKMHFEKNAFQKNAFRKNAYRKNAFRKNKHFKILLNNFKIKLDHNIQNIL